MALDRPGNHAEFPLTKTVILVETDPVVMMDLHGIVAELFPVLPVVQGACFADVEKALANASIETKVIAKADLVNGDPAFFAALHTAATRGAVILVLGATALEGLPARLIEVPFTNDIIRAALLPDDTPGDADVRF